MHDVSRSK